MVLLWPFGTSQQMFLNAVDNGHPIMSGQEVRPRPAQRQCAILILLVYPLVA